MRGGGARLRAGGAEPGRSGPGGGAAGGGGAADPAGRAWLRGCERRPPGPAAPLRRGLAGAGGGQLPPAVAVPERPPALCRRHGAAQPRRAARRVCRGRPGAGAGDPAARHHDAGLFLAGGGAAAGACLPRCRAAGLGFFAGGVAGRRCGSVPGRVFRGAGAAGRPRRLECAAAGAACRGLSARAARLAGRAGIRRTGGAGRAGGGGGCDRLARCRHLRRTLLPQGGLEDGADAAGQPVGRNGVRHARRGGGGAAVSLAGR